MNRIASTFGQIAQPQELARFGSVETGGIGKLLNLFFNILIVGAGIYALINFIMAGYKFLGAGNDPKKIQAATSQIVQSVIGLVVVAGAFLISAIIGYFFLGSAGAILNPKIIAP